MVQEVRLEVQSLPDLTPIVDQFIDICIDYTWNLQVGSYRVTGTYVETGEVVQYDADIGDGMDVPIDLVFVAPPPPEHLLTIGTGEGGTTNPVPGDYYYEEGLQVSVQAIPDLGYVFSEWMLDGIQYSTNPIIVLIDTSHLLIAYFSTEEPPPPTTYNLQIGVSGIGTTDPSPGIYSYDSGTAAIVTAIPSAGYFFNYWELDGTTKTENPTTIIMNADHALNAFFSTAPPERRVPLKAVAGAVLVGLVYLFTRKK